MDAVLLLIYLYSFIRAVMSLQSNHPKKNVAIFIICNLAFVLGLRILVRDINLTDQTYSTVYAYQALLYLAIFVFGTAANLFVARQKHKKNKKTS